MAHEEQPSTAVGFSGDSSASAAWENPHESPPRPFPQRFPEFSRSYSHRERFAGMNHQGGLMNNEGSSAARDDPKSCFVASTTFSLFVALTMALGLYGSETLRLGPNTSMLIKPNHLFVGSVKVFGIGTAKGSMLYGFYQIPPLDNMITWPEIHKISLPVSTHKEWIYYLNEGSQIDISYSVASPSSSSLVLVIAKGITDLDEWLKDPLYPNPTLSWNLIYGNGSIQKYITESSIYYIGVGNLNREVVKVQLNATISALLYNTTEPYYKCKPADEECTLRLFFLGGNAAVLTSPGRVHGVSGDTYVKISYGPRWFTYFVGTGGMIFLLLLINYLTNHVRRTEQDTPQDHHHGGIESERNPLLSHKDDGVFSRDSSYTSLPEHEESHSGGEQGGKPVKDEDSQRLCAICFEAPKDSFFIPCGHCVACFGCATRIVETSGACPICRGNTKKVRKIYNV